MKRFLTVLLVCILLLPQGVSFSFGAGRLAPSNHYQINSAEEKIDDTIYEDDDFEYKVILKNGTGEAIHNIEVENFESTAFGKNNIKVINKDIESDRTGEIIFDLEYYGSGKYFDFDVIYTKADGTKAPAEPISVRVKDVKESSTDKGSSGSDSVPDPSKAIPRLVFDGQKIPAISAGEVLDLDLVVKNISNYSARHIVVTPLFQETEGEPFLLETSNMKRTIKNLSGNKNTEINFKIKVSDNAQAKTHPLKIKFDFVNAHGIAFEHTETVYITVTNQKSHPKLLLSRLETTPKKIEAGEPVQVVLYLKNNGNLTARNVALSIDGLENDGFTIVNGGNSQFFKEIKGSSEVYAIFNLHASSRLTNGNHSLKLKLNYKDQANTEYSEEQLFFLTVGNELGRGPQVEITNIDAPQGGIGINDSFLISFDVTNTGETAARNVKVSVDGQEALLPKSQNIRLINNLSGKETSNQQFNFYVSSEAALKNHPLLIKVEYDQGSEETKETIQQYVGINVEGGSGNTTPKIIIDEYSFTPQIVPAGENFDLSLSFLNTNQTKTVENIKIFLTVNETTEESGNVFTPVNSSNTFYIDHIPPKGRVQEFLTLYAVPDAKPKTYTITANFEYEDSSGEKYEATELIGIPVVQQSRLEVSDFSLPSETFLGQPMPLFVEFYNMGKVTLSNMMIKIEGNFDVQNGSYFVGNFESGYSDYFEGTIIPSEPGPLEGNVIFSYENSAGEYVEIIKPITSNVIEMPQEEFPPGGEFPPMEEEQSFFKKLIKSKILWGTVIVLAVGGGIFIWRRKKKKKGMAEDEVY